MQDNTKMIISFSEFSNKIKELIKPNKSSYIIGVAGGSGSGKTFIAKKISENFPSTIIKIDDYYIRGICKDNKDTPEALNLDLLKKHIKILKQKEEIEKPVYTFGLKKDYTEKIKPENIIIVEGLFALSEIFSKEIDLKIFVDADEKIRFERRLVRDIKERGYSKENVIQRWNETIEPMYKRYVIPQKEKADLIIFNQ